MSKKVKRITLFKLICSKTFRVYTLSSDSMKCLKKNDAYCLDICEGKCVNFHVGFTEREFFELKSNAVLNVRSFYFGSTTVTIKSLCKQLERNKATGKPVKCL